MQKIQESKLLNSIEPITIEIAKKIMKQMENCICSIKNGHLFGNGFLFKFSFGKDKECKVLMTGYNMIKTEDINKNNNIGIFLGDEKEKKYIQLGNKRRIYSDEKLGIRMIILENKDNINNDKNYLELDDNLLVNNFNFKNNSIYILQRAQNKIESVSFGKISEIKDNKIKHLCKKENGSYGSPILNLSNNKVIGIQNDKQNSGFNVGTFLKMPILLLRNKKEEILNNNDNDKLRKLEIGKSLEISFIKKPKIEKIMNSNVLQNQINNMSNQQMNPQINQQIFQQMNPPMNNSNQFNNMNYNMNIGMMNQNNIGNNMINNNNLNNNMNMNNEIKDNNINNNNINMMNNLGFLNDGNNNINNGCSQNNFQMGNQLNMMNMNDNMINQNNKDGVINELSQGFCPKITFIFKDAQGPNININADYGTTIHHLLLNYFKRIGKSDIMRSNLLKCFKFICNNQTLNNYDQTKIEDIFWGGSTPIIIVFRPENLKEIKFKTTSNFIYTMHIISYFTVNFLLKLFLDEVKKPNLFGKSDKICFIHNGNKINYEENQKIYQFFMEKEPIIIVIDKDNLINDASIQVS